MGIEKRVSTPEYRVALPGDQEFTTIVRGESLVCEALVKASENSPISREALGKFIYGDEYDPELHSGQVASALNIVKIELLSRRLSIKDRNEEGQNVMWVEGEISESSIVVRKPSSQERALIRREDLQERANALFEKMTPLDRETIEDLFDKHPEATREQIQNTLVTVEEFRVGERQQPQLSEILNVEGREEKVELAVSKLQGLLSLSILNPNDAQIKNIFGWGKQLNELMLMLGGGEIGKESLFDAIQSLNDVERSLLLSQMSMTKRYEIMKVGIDQVNEREMASFINIAVRNFMVTGDSQDLVEVITTTVSRDSMAEEFSAQYVIECINKYYSRGSDFIFNTLIKASRHGDFEYSLKEFFETHEAGVEFVREIEEGLSDDYIPRNRRL